MVMQNFFDIPILFLIFNRPGKTARVFERIRRQKPIRLYIASDGPRPDRRGEEEACQQTRVITENIDWPCEVNRLYRDENLGCKKAVSSAIDWFFGREEAGIILEDDCLPDASFFPYCKELLKQYKDDPEVLSIAGNNIGYDGSFPASYGFTRYMNMWGWATWADRARSIRYSIEEWDDPSIRHRLKKTICALGTHRLRFDPAWWLFWKRTFDRLHRGEIDSWAYFWVYSGLHHNQRCIFPTTNLVANIGFGEGATHTSNPDCIPGQIAETSIAFPLVHPISKEIDPYYERQCARLHWCGIEKSLRVNLRAVYHEWKRRARLFWQNARQ